MTYLLSKQSFNELADYRGANCVSIFLPTHRKGMEVNRREDEILLKNMLKDISDQLEASGFSKAEADNYLGPAYALLENTTFWNNLSDGLVLFIGDRFFKHYTLPIRFEKFTYLADHFYLRPLMPLYNGDGRFFLLALTQDEVRFFEGTRYSLKDLYVEDITPNRLEEVVGYDYEQKSLQFHSAQQGLGRAMFHGRGEGKDEDKTEIRDYFKAINDGLMKMLREETAPLIVACVDYLFPIYREANTYPHLYQENISGSVERDNSVTLHEKAWRMLEPYFQKTRQEQVTLFNELMSTQRVASQVEDIVPAAVNGRIDTLFIQNQKDVYGMFNPTSQNIQWDNEKRSDNMSLLNLAAIKTFQQGGKVFLMEPEEMPLKNMLANAIFRF